jgi:anaerobic ribonucleoside-triphosphate reductase
MGQSLSLTHLAKFVDVSRKAIKKEIVESYNSLGINPLTEEQLDILTEERLKKEIASGIQTIQYQILTLMTTNG